MPKRLTLALARNKVTKPIHRDIVVRRECSVAVDGQEVVPLPLRLRLGRGHLGSHAMLLGRDTVTVKLLLFSFELDLLLAHKFIND